MSITLAASATALAAMFALPAAASAQPGWSGPEHERNAAPQFDHARSAGPSFGAVFDELLGLEAHTAHQVSVGPPGRSVSVSHKVTSHGSHGSASASSHVSVSTGSVTASVHSSSHSSGSTPAPPAQQAPPPAAPAPKPPAAPPAAPVRPAAGHVAAPPASHPNAAAAAQAAVRVAPLEGPALISIPKQPTHGHAAAPQPAPEITKIEAVAPSGLLTAPGTGILLAALFGFAGGVCVVVYAAGYRGRRAR